GSYAVIQPDPITVHLSTDPMICKAGTTKLYVTARGGTKPYIGIGTFTVDAGFKSYVITDANGCTGHSSVTVTNGTLTAPAKPGSISGTHADATGLCGGGDFTYSVSKVLTATGYSWKVPSGCTASKNSNDGSSIILHAPSAFKSGTLSVTADNA